MQPHWIGVDWGTTNLRVFAIGEQGVVLAEEQSSCGMGTLKPDQCENVLLALIEPWLSENKTTPVFACGMVGARQGWQEAQYLTIPCPPVSDQHLTRVHTEDKRIVVQIMPGLCQQEPSDVMRGDVTIIGATDMVSLYNDVFTDLGIEVAVLDAKSATVAGLTHAAMSITDNWVKEI